MSARDLLDTIWLVPALPLLGAAVLGLFGRRFGEPRAGWLATGLMGLAFVWSLVMLGAVLSLPEDARVNVVNLYTWLPAGALTVNLGFMADPLSITWILLVTGVGSLIHLYAIGYMHGDARFARFFAYFNLFAASMLVLVLASSFLLTFVGWEGVGLCSYLLIGFWSERRRASSASVKAFVTNRVGDFGLMVAMLFIVGAIGSLDYAAMNARAGGIAQTTATAIALLIFLGCVGKSAQIGLHVWLPDAMEGPTPVSALIHAATMVTAGVFLVARANPFFERSGDAMTVVAVVGALTAIFAGTIAIVQVDVKRVLAYSTVSQLGYMFLALGVGAYEAAVFFVISHAFYKGCLFLGAGSTIHATDDDQDLRTMGGLRRYLPFTGVAFLLAGLSISGIPPLTGYWAKDGVLEKVFESGDYPLWAIGVLAAFFTSFYIFREIRLVFYGNERFRAAPAVAGGSDELEPGGSATAEDLTASPTVDYGTPPAPARLTGDPHEVPWVMRGPVLVLAGLAVVGGLLNLPIGGLEFLDEFLAPVFRGVPDIESASIGEVLGLSAITVGIGLVGIYLAIRVYRRGLEDPEVDPTDRRLGVVGRLFGSAWFYDAGITAAVGGPIRRMSDWLAQVFDLKIIDGAVNGVGSLFRDLGGGLRRLQTGLVRQYALGVVLGAVLLLLYALARVGLT